MKPPSAIELAPEWKRSLPLASPVILASGRLAEPGGETLGAVVTRPLTMSARSGPPQPRIVEVPGGLLLRTGAANPGLARMVQRQRRAWNASTAPVIVAFAAQGARDWGAMAAYLRDVPGVAGIEIHLNATVDAPAAIRAIREASDVPILAKLDLDDLRDGPRECVQAGANALVIARPPRGMARIQGRDWYGRLYAPAVKPLVLRAVADVVGMNLAPVVACGGIHSAADAREFLAAGAVAVEIDSAAWLVPSIAGEIAAEVGAGGPTTPSAFPH